MCGIVGFVTISRSGFSRDQVDAFRDLIHVTSLRGMDATGLFYTTNFGDVQVHKESINSVKFLESDEWKATDKELFSTGHAAVAHCRAATRGAKTDENAHPFRKDHIILVHNGTLNNHHALENTQVDSEAIARELAKEDDVATALQKINGAYALVWYNVKTQTLNMVRNDDRPLWLAPVTDGGLMFASDPSFIWLSCYRNHIKYDSKKYPTMLPAGELLTIDLTEFRDNDTQKKIDITYRAPFQSKSYMGQEQVYGVPFKPTVQENRYRSTTAITPLIAAELLGIGEFECPPGNAQGYTYVDRSYYRKLANVGDELKIELCDYTAVDEQDASNIKYFVFGKVMSADPKLNGFGVFWEIDREDEQSVIDYVINKRFYQGKLDYAISKDILAESNKIIALYKIKEVTNLSTLPVDQMQ